MYLKYCCPSQLNAIPLFGVKIGYLNAAIKNLYSYMSLYIVYKADIWLLWKMFSLVQFSEELHPCMINKINKGENEIYRQLCFHQFQQFNLVHAQNVCLRINIIKAISNLEFCTHAVKNVQRRPYLNFIKSLAIPGKLFIRLYFLSCGKILFFRFLKNTFHYNLTYTSSPKAYVAFHILWCCTYKKLTQFNSNPSFNLIKWQSNI